MNAVTQVPVVATGEAYDLAFLRESLKACLRARIPTMGSTLADRYAPRKRTKEESPLGKPSATIELETIEDGGVIRTDVKIKPQYAQWPTTTHATPTRPPGFSREAMEPRDFTKSAYVKAISRLESLYITSIRARYSPGKHTRLDHRRKLAATMAGRYKDPQVKARARLIALTVLSGKANPQHFRLLFGMDEKQWLKSPHRKQVSDIKGRLAIIDSESLLAWDAKCREMDERG